MRDRQKVRERLLRLRWAEVEAANAAASACCEGE